MTVLPYHIDFFFVAENIHFKNVFLLAPRPQLVHFMRLITHESKSRKTGEPRRYGTMHLLNIVYKTPLNETITVITSSPEIGEEVATNKEM